MHFRAEAATTLHTSSETRSIATDASSGCCCCSCCFSLLFGTIFGCVDPITTIVACLGGGRSVFTVPVGMKDKAAEAHSHFAVKGSDLLTLLRVYDAWADIRDVRSRRDFCRDHFLSDSALLAIATLRNQLLTCLVELKFLNPGNLRQRDAANRYASSARVLKAVTCAGLYPRVVKIKLPQRKYIETSAGAMEDLGKVEQTKYLLQGGERVYLHPGSVMVKEAPEANMNLFLIFYEKVETSKVYLRDATDISPVSALQLRCPSLRCCPAAVTTAMGTRSWTR
jgi:HrpA-like RNA helicase